MSNATWGVVRLPNLDIFIDIRIKIVLTVCGVAFLMFNGTSLVALYRTRQTPRTARFLAAALLVFDFLTNLFLQSRKFAVNFRGSLMLQFFGNGSSFLSYLTIAVMSIERLIVFQWPNFYLRLVSFPVFKRVSVIFWTLYLGSWICGIGYCFIVNDHLDSAIADCADVVMIRYVVITCPLSTFVSAVCFLQIAVIIRKQTEKVMKKGRSIQHNKSTIVVFFCLLNYVATSICYAIIMFVTNTDHQRRRVFMDILMMMNGLIDTCVYVLWYKECRLELLKMFANICPCLEDKIERMRINIFDVITYGRNLGGPDMAVGTTD